MINSRDIFWNMLFDRVIMVGILLKNLYIKIKELIVLIVKINFMELFL